MQQTTGELQQSLSLAHLPPSAAHATVVVPTHCPPLQKQEQHWKPAVHAAPAFEPAGGVAMQAASVQKPRMFGVSSCCTAPLVVGAREKEIVATIGQWRLARDIRAYVADVQALVDGAGLEITKGGNAEEELKWALAHADRIDPLTEWRKDIESVQAEKAGRPCPKCGKVHGEHANEEGEADATVPTSAAPEQASGSVDNG